MNKNIIASLTTLPNRINLTKPTLNSIINQVDWIEFNIPYFCKRTKQEYTIPEWLCSMEKVKIFRTTDIGPLTKIIPTLQRHTDKFILSIDDDVEYPNQYVEKLLSESNPKRIVSGSGIHFFRNRYTQSLAGSCHTLEGFAGLLYPPFTYTGFSYFEKTNENIDCFLSDDVVLSNWLVNLGFELWKANIPQPPQFNFGINDPFALHQQNNMINRYFRVIIWLKKQNMLYIHLSPLVFRKPRRHL